MKKNIHISCNKNNKGFTLVELIVVIVILAILIGVTIGGIYMYVGKARVNTDIHNAKAIDDALSAMSVDEEIVPLFEECCTCSIGSSMSNFREDAIYLDHGMTGFLITRNNMFPMNLTKESGWKAFVASVVVPIEDGNVTVLGSLSTKEEGGLQYIINNYLPKYIDEIPKMQSSNDALYIYFDVNSMMFRCKCLDLKKSGATGVVDEMANNTYIDGLSYASLEKVLVCADGEILSGVVSIQPFLKD